MPAQINWQHGGNPGNIEKLRADLEKHRNSDVQYVLVHIADLAALLDNSKQVEDERKRIAELQEAIQKYYGAPGRHSLWSKG